MKVSGGKALIGWGCATIAASYFGVQKVLVVIPARSHDNFINYEQQNARRWLKAVPEVYDYRGVPKERRLVMARMPGIHVVTEGFVQSKDGAEMLAAIDARAYIVDEVHNFTRTSAARAKRLAAAIKRTKLLGHKVYCVVMSASLGTAGMQRQWEFLSFALDKGSPLPIDADSILPTLARFSQR